MNKENVFLETILRKLHLHLEDLIALSEHFTERELIDAAFEVYVERNNGNIEKEFEDAQGLGNLTSYEQMLHKLFKRKVEFELAFELDEADDESVQILFDGDYSEFTSNVAKYGKFDGAIRLTKKFPEHIVMQLVDIARKCNIGVVKQ